MSIENKFKAYRAVVTESEQLHRLLSRRWLGPFHWVSRITDRLYGEIKGACIYTGERIIDGATPEEIAQRSRSLVKELIKD